MSNTRQSDIHKYGFSARSRRDEFATGSVFKEKAPDGSETIRSAITAAGGDPSKYIGVNKWDAQSIRTVEDDRYRSQRED